MAENDQTTIIAVVNQKGGVGKSTVAFHLAHGAAQFGGDGKGGTVLCFDLDTQGNLSQYLTGDLTINKRTTGGVDMLFERKKIAPSRTKHERIDVLHGHEELDRLDASRRAWDRGFSREMYAFVRSLGYRYIIIDTPTSPGLRHSVPLAWADVAVIPLKAQTLGVLGFQDVLTVKDRELIQGLNPGLKWTAVVNMARLTSTSQSENVKWLRENYGDYIAGTLGDRTAVCDAMDMQPARPVWMFPGARRELRSQWLDFCKKVLAL